MSSIAVDWVEINTYCETIGPQKGRPPRPRVCPHCDRQRIWLNGWRSVFTVVLLDGAFWRFNDGVWLQRVKCAACKRAWTLYPSWMYPHRQFQLDVVEVAALSYLAGPTATYRDVAACVGCSASSVWRWVGWCATVAEPGAIVAQATKLDPSTPCADLIPHEVPQTHDKAHSSARALVLLLSLQVLVALGGWSRTLPHPSADPSPLRTYVVGRFQRFREILHLTWPKASPGMQHPARGPPL